ATEKAQARATGQTNVPGKPFIGGGAASTAAPLPGVTRQDITGTVLKLRENKSLMKTMESLPANHQATIVNGINSADAAGNPWTHGQTRSHINQLLRGEAPTGGAPTGNTAKRVAPAGGTTTRVQ